MGEVVPTNIALEEKLIIARVRLEEIIHEGCVTRELTALLKEIEELETQLWNVNN